MKNSLVAVMTLLIWASPAFARYDVRCGENGGTYDVFTRQCVPDTNSSQAVEPTGSGLIRTWSKSADLNKKALQSVLKGLDRCDYRGAAHQEPDFKALRSIEVKFSDGIAKRIIPAETSCEYENSKFELTAGKCKLSFYEYIPMTKKFIYSEREVSFNTNSSNLSWKDSRGGSFQVNSLSDIQIEKAMPDDEGISVDRDGSGCQLARAINQNQSSERSVSTGTSGGRSTRDGVQ